MSNSKQRLSDVYKDLPVGQVVTLFMESQIAQGPKEDLTRVESFQYQVTISSAEFVEPRKIGDITKMVADSLAKATIKYTGIKFERRDLILRGQMHFWSVIIEEIDEMEYKLSK